MQQFRLNVRLVAVGIPPDIMAARRTIVHFAEMP